jgi:uncharacterized protein YkvS
MSALSNLTIIINFSDKQIDTKLIKTIILTKGAGAQAKTKYKIELYTGIGYLCEFYETIDGAIEKYKEIAPFVTDK